MLIFILQSRLGIALTPLWMFLLVVAAETGPSIGYGGEIRNDAADYGIENWQVEQGLPQNSVTSIAQTPDGYLWLGTFNGLVRFDGVQFKTFDEANTPALGSSEIAQLEVDDEGALWIMTSAPGLVRMAGGRFTALPKEEPLPVLANSQLLHDPFDRLLLVDRQGELYQVHGRHLRPLDRLDRLRTNSEPCLLTANSKSETRVVRHGKPSWFFSPTAAVASGGSDAPRPLGVHINAVATSQAGGYWLAATTGVYRLHQGHLSERVAPLPAGLSGLHYLREDGRGNLWAGRWNKGVYRLDAQGSWQEFSAGKGLADNYVNCLYRDREGSLWVGTGQGGLHRFRPHAIRTYDTMGGAGSNVVTSVTQDRQGRMWFGVNGTGLHELENDKLKPAAEPPEMGRYPLVYSVLAAHQGALWIGIYGQTLLRWQAGAVAKHNLTDEIPGAMTPYVLFEDHTGNIWLGCTRGLLRYQGDGFVRYTCRDGLSCDRVSALAEDSEGTLFIGTVGGGVNRLRNGSFTALTARDGLANNHVTALHVDRDDTLWIGTANGGLSRLSDGRFSTFTTKDGLPSNAICSLLEDDEGNLWIGSNRGIACASRKALNAYADGDRRSLTWRVFGLGDGLKTIACASGSQPACWKARDGRLWFATNKGVAVADPKDLPLNPLPPPVVIEEVVMDDFVFDTQKYDLHPEDSEAREHQASAAVSPRRARGGIDPWDAPHESSVSSDIPSVKVPAHTHRVEFRFTGLSLVAPDKVRFRYRLEGFDDDWVEAGLRRTTYYHRIPPGEYSFRVTACNNDGVWNEKGATLGIVVLPAWWQTWWFRAAALVGAVGLVGWAAEARVQRLKRSRATQRAFSRRLLESQEAERHRIATELHDSLGQDLLVIKNRAILGSQDPTSASSAREQLGEISKVASHTLEEIREISRNLRPYQLDHLGLTKALQTMITGVSESSAMPIQIDLDSIDGLLERSLEIHFYRVVQELLNNLVKHSHAATARISAKRLTQKIRLTVEDDGCGFRMEGLDTPSPPQGLGLTGVAERVRLLGGNWHCESRPAAGTRWTIEVPITAKASA
jgi:signal transduction histidine kinase/ligand-binding sensor domain-containing protein